MVIGRNTPCPCGSGRKYKKCCGANPISSTAPYADAMQLYESGKLTEALGVCLTLLAKKPADSAAGKLAGMVNYDLGVAQQTLGNVHQALKHYRKALDFLPDEPDIHANIGTACFVLGDIEQALEHYLYYLSLGAEDLAIRSRVAGLLLEKGKLAAAKEHYQTIIARDPENVLALEGLARLYEQHQDRDAAIRQYQVLLAINDNHDIRLHMLQLMILRGQFEEVIQTLLAVTEQYPDYHEYHYLLADVYRQQGLYQRADDIFRELADKYPEEVNIRIKWAGLMEQQHELIRADEIINGVLEYEPDNEEALLLCARLARRQNHLEDADNLLNKAKPEENRIDAFSVNYHFERGVTLDKLAHYDEAFKSMVAANRAKAELSGNKFDQTHQLKAFDYLKSVLDEPVLKRLQGIIDADSTARPVFIVGFPRSGTTLLEQILASHPAVIAGDELPYIPAIENYYCQAALNSKYQYPDCLAKTSIKRHSVIAMRDFYLQGVANQGLPVHTTCLFTDKMPLNLLYLGLIHMIFPRSPIIHIRRHPLDTCLSAFFTNFRTGNRYAMNIEDTAFYYGQVMSLTEHYKRYLPLNYLEIAYEDLVMKSEPVVRDVLDFIGIEWDERCLKPHMSSRVSMTSSYEQVTKPMYSTSIGRYRYYSKHLETIAPVLEPLIIAHDKSRSS